MSIAAKQRLAQIIYIAGLIVTGVCILKMIPYGLGGDVGKVKLWFAFMVLSFVVTVPFALAYYYYRARSRDLENVRAEANILSTAGKNITRPKPPQK